MVPVSLAFVALLVLSLSPACKFRTASDPWAYPVRLGDSRARVHELLGSATRTTEAVEEYPLSGVSVWFNPEGRVTKLNFSGAAAGLNSVGTFDSIPSDRSLMFGLTADIDEAGFRHLLGPPTVEAGLGSMARREARLVWRKGGYTIDAHFLATDRPHDERLLAKGCLLWFEISPGGL
jgi:hypothetical protein